MIQNKEEEVDFWMPIGEKAMQKRKTASAEMKINLIHTGVDEQTAGEKAYFNILHKLQKEFEIICFQRLQWIQQIEKDPVHKKLMQTKDSLVNDDDFDPEEAMAAVVDKRKFLIKRRLQDSRFTEDSDDEDH